MKPYVFVLAGVVLLSGCAAKEQTTGGPREVQLSVTDRGFEPAETIVKKGEPLTLVVTRKTDQTCATEIVLPSLDQRHALPLNQPVRVEFPAGIGDTLRYVCGMNMLGGTIVAR